MEGKLQIGDIVEIKPSIQSNNLDQDIKQALFGQCKLDAILQFWGCYTIVSMVTTGHSSVKSRPVYHLFWIETNFLDIPLHLQ
jgi:hypothetical protein